MAITWTRNKEPNILHCDTCGQKEEFYGDIFYHSCFLAPVDFTPKKNTKQKKPFYRELE